MNASALVFAGALLSSITPQDKSFSLPVDMTGQTILYVGAHPDDEWGLAPILAEACVDRGARCHFVVVASAASAAGAL